MKNTKDSSILDLIRLLDLPAINWGIVDLWECDLCAIGVVSALNPRKLVYVSTFGLKEGLFNYSCEDPLENSSESSCFETIKDGVEVTFNELEAIMTYHFE